MKCIGILITLIISPVCHAEIYKWTDEHGRVHYGERPASKNTEKVEIKSSPSNHDPGISSERQEKQRKLLEVLEEERQEKAQKKEEELKQKREIERECAELNDYYQSLKEVNLVYELDEEGNRNFLSEDQHQQEIAEVEKYLDKHCK